MLGERIRTGNASAEVSDELHRNSPTVSSLSQFLRQLAGQPAPSCRLQLSCRRAYGAF